MQSRNVSAVSSLDFHGVLSEFNRPYRLLNQSYFLLPLLGSIFPLETAVGMNGRVWVNANPAKCTIAIVRCIEAADPDRGGMDEAGIKQLLASMNL